MYTKTVSKFKRPIGSGAARVAFYSKKYDLVFKKTLPHSNNDQMVKETSIFNHMTDDEKLVFPIVDAFEYKGNMWIAMKKIHTFCDLGNHRKIAKAIYINTPAFIWDDTPMEVSAREIFYETPFSMESIMRYLKFTKKYQICDLHYNNIGHIGDQICIIDAGL